MKENELKSSKLVKVIIGIVITLGILISGYIVYDAYSDYKQEKKEYITEKEKIEKEQVERSKRLEEIDLRLNELDKEISDARSKYDMTRISELTNEQYKLRTEKSNLESADWWDENTNKYDEEYSLSTFKLTFTIGKIFSVVIFTTVISIFVYTIGNHKKIIARNKQIAKERIEDMGTAFGKAVANAAKEINPDYKSLKCPNCGASLDGDDIEVCEYCGSKLIKVGKFN